MTDDRSSRATSGGGAQAGAKRQAAAIFQAGMTRHGAPVVFRGCGPAAVTESASGRAASPRIDAAARLGNPGQAGNHKRARPIGTPRRARGAGGSPANHKDRR